MTAEEIPSPEGEDRAAFEAAYRDAYKFTCEIRPEKFERNASDDYEDVTVMVGWRMWRAARSALAAHPQPAPEPDSFHASAFIQHVQSVADGGHSWADEFIKWYSPGEWLSEERAAAVFLGGKLACQPAPAEAHGIEVSVGRMTESNGRVTWMVMLHRQGDQTLLNGHQVYSSHIEGRAQYEAAALRHFLGQGPEPDILDYDTDGAAQSDVQPKGTADDRQRAASALADLELLPEDRAPLEAIVAAGYQHARTLKSAAPASVPEPHGWIVWWPAMGGGHKPIYTHGAQKPSYGPELGSKLRLYPVYDAAQAPAPAYELPEGFVPVEAGLARKLAEKFRDEDDRWTAATIESLCDEVEAARAFQAPAVKDARPMSVGDLLQMAIDQGITGESKPPVQNTESSNG